MKGEFHNEKNKLFAVVSTILAMGLVACNGPKSSSKPDASSPSSEPAIKTDDDGIYLEVTNSWWLCCQLGLLRINRHSSKRIV